MASSAIIPEPRLAEMAWEAGQLLNQHRGSMLWAELIAFKDPGFQGARDQLADKGVVLEAMFGKLKDLAVIGDAEVSAFIASRLGPS